MKRTTIILWTLLAGAAMFSSCSKDTPVQYAMTNQNFVTVAASSFNFQIQAGTLAQTTGVNDSVKSYGAEMVKDNTAAYASLKTLATSKGLIISTTLQASDQTNLAALQAKTGAAFDQLYAQTMILTHNQELNFFQVSAQATGVEDNDLRTFAYNQVPLIALRLQSAYTLQTRVASE